MQSVTKMRVGIEVIVSAGFIIGISERHVEVAGGVLSGFVATNNGAINVAHGFVEVGAPGGLVESFVVVVGVLEANLAALRRLQVVEARGGLIVVLSATHTRGIRFFRVYGRE